MVTFSPRKLRAAREAVGYRREDLASRAGVSFGSVVCWETGKSSPSAQRLAVVAGVLDVDLADLFDEVDA